MTDKLSHFNDQGQAHMVDVSSKTDTLRTAKAEVFVEMNDTVINALPDNSKGNPLEVARIAGIMAAKRTSELIPMCHPLSLSFVDIELQIKSNGISISAEVRTTGPTGVEMEALTAASVAALTVYDMTKALDKSIEITGLRLVEKTGGKSGHYKRGDR